MSSGRFVGPERFQGGIGMPFRGFCFLGLHKWGVWKPVENLSCTETIVCSACGDIKEARTVHKHKGLQWEYINDSCAQNGLCGKCGAIAESCVVRHDYQWVYLDESCKLHFSCRSEEHTSELQSPCNLVCR